MTGALDAAASAYADEVARRLAGALGDDLAAVYVIGSGALGDWLPGRSDVDVLAVCERALTSAGREAVVAPLWHATLPCPTRGLELVVHRRDAVAAPGAAVAFEVNLNTGPGMDDHASFDPGDEPAHWFLLDLAMARDHARPVLGPPPRELLGPVARPHALAALRASLRWHAAEEAASANTVLNACRAWRYAADGAWVSKLAAARWALARGADAGLLEGALALRAAPDGAPLDPHAVAALVARVTAEVERTAR